MLLSPMWPTGTQI